MSGLKARVQADLKEYNRLLVYNLVKAQGPISRTDMARKLALSVPTVLKIIEYYSGLGLVAEAGEGDIALGRKPKLLSIRPDAALTVGAQYDGVHLSVGLVNLDGVLVASRRVQAPPDLQLLLGSLLPEEVESLLATHPVDRGRVHGLGLGVPGVVNSRAKKIMQAPLVGVADSVDYGYMTDDLTGRLGLPVHVVNDANAAALGELSARHGDGAGDLIFVELGRGVGAGIVLDGRLREGPGFGAGEIGYMLLDHGAVSTGIAGAGCGAAGGAVSVEAATRQSGAGWLETTMDMASLWSEMDGTGSVSDSTLRRVCEPLALALANLCIALDVREVVVGQAGAGGFGDGFIPYLDNKIRSVCPFDVSCRLSLAAEAGVVGAAGVARDEWLKLIAAG